MNGKEYGFQHQLSEVNEYDNVPGWCSAQKMDYLRWQLRDTMRRIPPSENGQWFEVLDLGSWKGRSASAMADALPEDGPYFLWCVDHWLGSPGERETNHIQAGIRPLSVYWEFLKYTSKLNLLGHRIGPLTLPSEEAVKYFDDQQFSFIFLDTDHEDVYSEMVRWIEKLRIGGTMVVDDLEWATVYPDVQRFLEVYGTHYHIDFDTKNVDAWVARMVRNK